MKIGLFGGTFDPPHVGHLTIAESAHSHVGLDTIIWVTASIPPHREISPFASASHRHEMVKLATRGNEAFEASDLELRREGRSFTIETVHEMEALHPGSELFLIVGGDSLRAFDTWKAPDDILRHARLIAFARDHHVFDEVDPGILERTLIVPQVPLLDVSSSRIRKMIVAGRSIRYLVPDSVADYIHRHRLYAPPHT
jgi:nicotinate-nucleotide adenylyltransferase